jgi:hypothetical protein
MDRAPNAVRASDQEANAMPNLVVLEGIELTPVLELEPCTFATQPRKSPSGTFSEVAEEWFHYWSDCLEDSGITDLRPLRRGSWHVPTVNFGAPLNLQKFLERTFQEWGGIDSLSEPDCRRALNGGLALQCPAGDVLIEPRCCVDLGDAKDWKAAAEYRGTDWQMLWIGHPWLSVRYQEPLLILSEPHESNNPADRWSVFPEELNRAVDRAKTELGRFAGELARLLPVLGYRGDPAAMGRKLAGLCE